jgi:hypothetical protein
VLVLRIWLEPGLRARITADAPLGGGKRESVAVGSVDEILGRVRVWVEEFMAGANGQRVR